MGMYLHLWLSRIFSQALYSPSSTFPLLSFQVSRTVINTLSSFTLLNPHFLSIFQFLSLPFAIFLMFYPPSPPLSLSIFPSFPHSLSFSLPSAALELNAQITSLHLSLPLNLSFFPLCWAWIFYSSHQICIPLIKLNYSWLPNILCRWLSTQNAWLWTSNDMASLAAELQPSEKRPRANDQPPYSLPSCKLSAGFFFLWLF